MQTFPATLAYISGNNLELTKLVWSFFLDPHQQGSVPMFYNVPNVGYVIGSAFGHCPLDSGVMVYFWCVGGKYAVLMTEDESWDWNEAEETNIQNYQGVLFNTLEEVKQYIQTGQ